jgi:hypothetical protein
MSCKSDVLLHLIKSWHIIRRLKYIKYEKHLIFSHSKSLTGFKPTTCSAPLAVGFCRRPPPNLTTEIQPKITDVDIDPATESWISLCPETHTHQHEFPAGPTKLTQVCMGFGRQHRSGHREPDCMGFQLDPPKPAPVCVGFN